MPKIGMRIIKTAVSVFICFLIYFLRGGAGLPFYSAISAIICMQAGVTSTKKAGLNRVAATFVGGAYGLAVLLIPRFLFGGMSEFAGLIISSILIIPLIYTMVLLDYKAATSTCCIVFLSIAVNHAADVNPFIFTANRVIDTLIGIFVAIGVNAFHIPRKKNKDTLFLGELEGGLLDSKRNLSAYTKSSIEELIDDGANISFISKRTPGDLVNALNGINIKLPMIVMNGAAVFDWNKRTYLHYEMMDENVESKVTEILSEEEINVFRHTIINDIVHIYYGAFRNRYEEKFYHEEKLVPMKNYVYSTIPCGIKTMYCMAVDSKENIDRLYDRFASSEIKDRVRLCRYTYDKDTYFLKVYSSEASKEKALAKLKECTGLSKTVIFQSDKDDKTLLNSADYVYIIGDMGSMGKNKPFRRIDKDDHIAVISSVKKSFYNKELA